MIWLKQAEEVSLVDGDEQLSIFSKSLMHRSRRRLQTYMQLLFLLYLVPLEMSADIKVL